MRKHRFNSFMTAAVIASTLLTATACSKTFAPVDTLPVGTELPADTSTSTEAASTKQDSTTNKGGNTKETGTTKESGNASKDTGTGKDTGTKESDATEKSGEGDVSGETAKDSEAATKAGSDSSVTTATTANAETSKAAATVTETTTSKVTESTTAATQAPTEKATEKQTEKAAEKITESTTQAPAEKHTEKPTEPATQAHAHSYTATVTKQPTCTAEGVKTFRCSCGDSYTETIPAAGHIFGAYVYNNDATEAADGTETAACTICGAKDTRTAAGTKIVHVHNYTAAVTKAATCAEEGVTTYTCSCGHSYTEPIAKTAHSFGDYIYNDDATTEADGTKTATCSVCGATDTVTAEGTKKTLPSWYDEHPDIPLNVATGGQRDGSLEAYFTDFDWDSAKAGCGKWGYSAAMETIGKYAEGWVHHGYLYK